MLKWGRKLLFMLVCLLIAAPAFSDVYTETNLSYFKLSAEQDVEPDSGMVLPEANGMGYEAGFKYFFTGLKDGDDYESPYALKEFFQSPSKLGLSYGYRDRQWEIDGHPVSSKFEETKYGVNLDLFTPSDNFSTGISANFERKTLESDGADFKDTTDKAQVSISQYISRYFRLSLIGEGKKYEPESSSYKYETALAGGAIKFVIGEGFSLELGALGGNQKRKGDSYEEDFDVEKAFLEMGFYFGKYVYLLIGAEAQRLEPSDYNPSDYVETEGTASTTLGFWFGEHIGLKLAALADVYAKEYEDNGIDNKRQTLTKYLKGTLSFRF